MGRALAAVGGLLVLCFAILGVAVYLGREEESVAVDQILAEELSRQITLADGQRDPVDFDVIAQFRWDELVIVAPDTPREQIDAELGFAFEGELPYDAESQELFIFVRGKRLARFADYRGRGTFESLDRPFARFTPQTALFSVRGGTIRPANP